MVDVARQTLKPERRLQLETFAEHADLTSYDRFANDPAERIRAVLPFFQLPGIGDRVADTYAAKHASHVAV